MQVSLTTPAHPTWRNVRCHDWKGDALDEGDTVADWLSTFLKQKVRLVKYGGKLQPSPVIVQILKVYAVILAAYHPYASSCPARCINNVMLYSSQ